MNKELYPSEAFSKTGKILYVANILLILLMFIISFYIYSILPAKIPTHFGINGKPDAYGSKSMFLFLPLALSIAPIFIMLIVRYRYTLLNKYPYLINIPSFYTKIQKLPFEKRGIWINKYFKAILALNIGLSIGFILILYSIYLGVLMHGLPSWFNIMIFTWLAILIIGLILYLRRISKDIDVEIRNLFEE